jgi:hypothetical protein
MKKMHMLAALIAVSVAGVVSAGPACCPLSAEKKVEGTEVKAVEACAEAPAVACCGKVDGKCTEACLAKKAADLKCGPDCAAKKAAGEMPACCAAKAACKKAAAEKTEAPVEEKKAEEPAAAPAAE